MGIEIREVSKSFGGFAVLRDICLRVPKGEFVALLGPSGSGKTTLLRIIAGLEFPDSGAVFFGGEDAVLRGLRERRVGFVFQHYALFRHMTVFNNVAFGLRVKPFGERPPRQDIRARVMELLDMVQLEAFADRYPSQLSGGQRQRVALARALSIGPQVLLLDEPFGALDAQVRKELRRWLRNLQRELCLTSLFVTHDQEEAMELADRVVIMNEGRIEQAGSPQEVYDHPRTPFVHQFLGNTNRLMCNVLNGKAKINGLEITIPRRDKIKNGPGVLFVRPHDVEIGPPLTGQLRDAIIEDVSFAGPLLNLELLHIHSAQTFTAQIHRERWAKLALHAGDGVVIRLRNIKVFSL